MLYRAFISYSHHSDQRLAAALQAALQQFAKPYYAMRAFNVFRDQTDLSANPSLWPRIEGALNSSEFFLLLASPESAKSYWVKREIDQWLRSHQGKPSNLLLLLTDGQINWDVVQREFDWRTTSALPQALDWDRENPNFTTMAGIFTDQPFHVDLRWARAKTELSLRDPEFLDNIGTIAAELHGQPKSALVGRDVAEHKRFRQVRMGAIALLVILTISSVLIAMYATRQRHQAVLERDEASRQRESALARQLAAESKLLANRQPRMLHLSVLLAIEATRKSPSVYSDQALREEVALLPRVIATIRLGDSVAMAVFSHDGKYVATACLDGTAAIWETASGRKIAAVTHTRDVRSVAFSHDDHFLASSSRDGTVRVWEVETGREIFTVVLKAGVNSAVFSPDSKYLVAAANDRTVAVWTADSGQVVRLFKVDDDAQKVAFSFDGKYLCAMTWKSVNIWKTENWIPAGVIKHGSIMRDFAFSADGKQLATASTDHTARVWSVSSRRQIAVVQHEQNLRCVAFNPDGILLATGSRDTTARIGSES